MEDSVLASRDQDARPQLEVGVPVTPSDGGASKKFKFPMVREPSPEEHRTASLAWLELAGPTLIDQWPKDVLALSAPTIFVQVPVLEMLEIFGNNPRAAIEALRPLADELDSALGWDRRFFRLNSRSPKDATWPFEVPVTCSGREVLSVMGASERILDDLIEFKYLPEQPAYICLREYNHAIRPEREYRCFVRDGELIAVTHYDYTKPITAPDDGGRALREAINAYFRDTLKPRLHLQTVVFDLFIDWNDEFGLIELNPYGRSDPCWLGSYEEVERFAGYVAFAPPENGSQHAADTQEVSKTEGRGRPNKNTITEP